MKSLTVATGISTTDSAAVNADATPFHAGNQVVAMITPGHGGTGSGRGWTIQGNNAAEGETPVWEDLGAEVTVDIGIQTITMPRQIRLHNSTAGSGSKTADLHLIGN